MLYKQPTVSRRNVKDLQITGVLPCLNLNFGEEEPSQTDKKKLLSNCTSLRKGFLDKTEPVVKYKNDPNYDVWHLIIHSPSYRVQTWRYKGEDTEECFLVLFLMAYTPESLPDSSPAWDLRHVTRYVDRWIVSVQNQLISGQGCLQVLIHYLSLEQ